MNSRRSMFAPTAYRTNANREDGRAQAGSGNVRFGPEADIQSGFSEVYGSNLRGRAKDPLRTQKGRHQCANVPSLRAPQVQPPLVLSRSCCDRNGASSARVGKPQPIRPMAN